VRAAGQVSGTVSYGEIEIERGGRISGQMKPQEGDSATSYSNRRKPQDPATGAVGNRHASVDGTNGSAPELDATMLAAAGVRSTRIKSPDFLDQRQRHWAGQAQGRCAQPKPLSI